MRNKTGVSSMIHSAGQTHSLASSEHCFLLFCFASLKLGKDGRTDNMCKNNDPYRRDCGVAEWINICH